MNTAIIMDMMLNAGRIVGDLRGGKEDMTEKRFTRIICSNDEYTGSLYCNDEPLKIDTACNLLNELNDENNHIKQTIQEAYKTERTQIGKNCLKQLLQSLE